MLVGVRVFPKNPSLPFLTRFQALYTILIVCLNVISGGGGSNLYQPEEFATFTPLDIQERIHGSKIVLVSEQVRPIHYPRLAPNVMAGNAERHLHNQSLHADHVLASDPRSPSSENGLLPCDLCMHRLVCYRDRLFHRMSTIQRILGDATAKPTMHDAPTLRHCPSLL